MSLVGTRVTPDVLSKIQKCSEETGQTVSSVVAYVLADWARTGTKKEEPAERAVATKMSPETEARWKEFEEAICPITVTTERQRGFQRNQLTALVRECGSVENYQKTLRMCAAAHADKFAKGVTKATKPSELREHRGALYAYIKGRATQYEEEHTMSPEEQAFFGN